jgi:hypothetical protein
MKNTKLVELLSVMNVYELERFNLFVHSALYNNSQRVTQLFVVLQKQYPQFEAEKITDEKVFKSIFKGKAFAPALLRNLVSDLLCLCEQFIVTESINQNAAVKSQQLIYYYTEKKLFAHAEAQLHKWRAELNTAPHNSEYYQSAYMLVHTSFSVAFHHHYKGNLHKLYKRKSASVLIEALQNYYLYEFSVLSAEVVNSFKAHNQTFNTQQLEDVIQFYLSKTPKPEPIVLFRLQLSQMLLNGNEKLYATIKKTLLKINEQFHKTELRSIMVVLYGFAAERSWKGDAFFINELFDLTELREKFDLLLDDINEINPIAFINIASAKLNKKGKAAALEFIKKYSPNLPAKVREETEKLAMAKVWFAEKKYEKTIDLLVTMGKPFFASEITARLLQAKCHYELQQWDRLLAVIETTEKFIKNNAHQLPAQVSNATKSTMATLRLLYRCYDGNQRAITKVKAFMSKHPEVNEPDWIMAKLKQIEG